MAAASSAISSSLLSTLSLSGGTCSPCLPSLPAPLSLTFPLRADMKVTRLRPCLPDLHLCKVGLRWPCAHSVSTPRSCCLYTICPALSGSSAVVDEKVACYFREESCKETALTPALLKIRPSFRKLHRSFLNRVDCGPGLLFSG
jgi:hypothetical protein